MADLEPPPCLEPRPIFIDALNLAYWCSNPPSLRLPLTVLAALLAQRRSAKLYFDASARHQLKDEAGIYADLLQHSTEVIEVPSGKPADRVLLRDATTHGACILSRDKYRDYRKRYRRITDDPSRLLSGAVANHRVLVPALAIDSALPASVQDAWEQCKAGLSGWIVADGHGTGDIAGATSPDESRR